MLKLALATLALLPSAAPFASSASFPQAASADLQASFAQWRARAGDGWLAMLYHALGEPVAAAGWPPAKVAIWAKTTGSS